MPATKTTDFTVENHGSICLVRCGNENAKNHLKENTSDESQWHGDALVVEPRYLDLLVECLLDGGFSVQ